MLAQDQIGIEEWLPLAAGGGLAALVAGVAYAWAVKAGALGDKVVVYDPAVGEARNVAVNILPASFSKYPVSSGQAILEALQAHGRISRFVIVSHGAPDWVLNSTNGITMRGVGVSVEALGEALGRRLVTGAIVGLAGCSSARSYAEAGVWGPEAFGRGGVGSFAEALRNSISQHGFHPLVEVRGHTLSGGVTANPSGRACKTGRLRMHQPCNSIMYDSGETDWQRWVQDFTGDLATRWITGLS